MFDCIKRVFGFKNGNKVLEVHTCEKPYTPVNITEKLDDVLQNTKKTDEEIAEESSKILKEMIEPEPLYFTEGHDKIISIPDQCIYNKVDNSFDEDIEEIYYGDSLPNNRYVIIKFKDGIKHTIRLDWFDGYVISKEEYDERLINDRCYCELGKGNDIKRHSIPYNIPKVIFDKYGYKLTATDNKRVFTVLDESDNVCDLIMFEYEWYHKAVCLKCGCDYRTIDQIYKEFEQYLNNIKSIKEIDDQIDNIVNSSLSKETE